MIGVFFWGATFAFIKEAVAVVDVYSFLTIRFAIAALLLFVIFFRRFARLDLRTTGMGLTIGIVLALSFVFQTIGIKYTSASNAAFITGLCVVIVPVLVIFIDRKPPSALQAVSIAAATAGLALLTLKDGFAVSRGDIWVFLCAFTFAAHILMVGRMIKSIDAALFSFVQLLTVAIVSFFAGLAVNGGIDIPAHPAAWRGIIFCAVFGSAYMYTVQAHYQKYITEVKAALIYSLEPVFAAVVAFLYLGETVTARAAAGGALIFAAMLIADIRNHPG